MYIDVFGQVVRIPEVLWGKSEICGEKVKNAGGKKKFIFLTGSVPLCEYQLPIVIQCLSYPGQGPPGVYDAYTFPPHFSHLAGAYFHPRMGYSSHKKTAISDFMKKVERPDRG